MKKFLLTFLLLISPANAFEDYMIISSFPVKSVMSEDKDIVNVKPVYTIDNEKKAIIVTPVSTGKTKILVDLFYETKRLNITVNDNSTTIKPEKGFNYYSIDIPPDGIEIILPPETSEVDN